MNSASGQALSDLIFFSCQSGLKEGQNLVCFCKEKMHYCMTWLPRKSFFYNFKQAYMEFTFVMYEKDEV
jgi:hypothetical protein